MAYRYGEREQMILLPQSIEDYVPAEHPVRVYDAFVEALDFGSLGIELDEGKVGNSEYDPRAMLKLLVYGYSYGVRSSRKLERETHDNLSFVWLMGGLRPDHKTIAEFRRQNKGALKKVLRQCAEICLKLGLIGGNALFVDGTKIRANAGRAQTHDQAYYAGLLREIDGRIERLLKECEVVDEKEAEDSSWVEIDSELRKANSLRNKVEEVLKSFEGSRRKQVNQTDRDCAVMHGVQGSHASYNLQEVVDGEHGLIVHAEAVSESTDVNQFARQIEEAQDVLGKPCQVACADAGYADTKGLKKISQEGVKVVVPSQRQALHEEEGPFSKSHFKYDKEHDCYWCPGGERLKYAGTVRRTGKRHYQISDRRICHCCPHYGQCTTSRKGRKIIRIAEEELKEKLEAQYEASKDIYAQRKQRVEHPFGHIKRNLKADAFLLRGRSGAQAESSLLATCFNLVRMMTILGRETLIKKLGDFRVLDGA
jgi:transposase/IS5 family transposase